VGDFTTYLEPPGIKKKHMSGGQKEQRFVYALAVFVLICQLVSRSNFVAVDPLSGKRRTWTTWALESFNTRLKSAPDVVFLGSSLMLTPLNMADAQALGTRFDGASHHESNWFEAIVRHDTGRPLATFNFALPGEMPSDAFLIEKLVLKTTKKPKLIIYGVGPRDFMDSLLDSPSATDPYHWLAKLEPESAGWEFCGHTFYQKLNFFACNALMPDKVRMQLAEDTSARLCDLVDWCVPLPSGTSAISMKEVHKMLPNYHAMDIAAGDCMFEPYIDVSAGRFVNNLDDYRERYAHPDWDKYETQFDFLAKTLDLANERHIKFALVAMPITSVNRGLIASSDWRAYKDRLSSLAGAKGAVFIDQTESRQFTDLDFGDTVHLNALGGLKLVELLAKKSIADPQLSEALGFKGEKGKVATKGVRVL
jgi:hypothetical protein